MSTRSDDSRPQEELSAKQDRLILALLTAPTQDAAAQEAGVHRATMYQWLRCPEFQTKFRAAQEDLYTHAIARIQSAASEAVDTLRGIMADDTAPHAARVTSAKTILDQATKAHSAAVDAQEIAEIKERLAKYIALTEAQNEHRETRGSGWV